MMFTRSARADKCQHRSVKKRNSAGRLRDRQFIVESLEPRIVFATGGLVSADPAYNQNPNSYSSFANSNLPILHSNPSSNHASTTDRAVLYLALEGGVRDDGAYFEPMDYEAKGTSTTTQSIAIGSKTFTTQTGLPFAVGNRVLVHDNNMNGPGGGPSANMLRGIVTAYSGTSLTVTVDSLNGTGSSSNWTIINTTFNADERESIVETWRQLSKSFAIFNVDVTTDYVDIYTKPTSLAGLISYGDGGVAFGNIGFGHTGVNIVATHIERYTGWVLPHEFGHSLGLAHQASFNNAGLVAYEYGEVISSYALPIMGNRVGVDDNANPHMFKWSNGLPVSSVTAVQDDIAVIAASISATGVTPYRTTEPDFSADFGGTAGTAATLTDLGGNDYGRAGTINSLSDVDYFTFTTTADGYVDIMLSHDVYGADFSLQVENSSGTIIAAEDGDATGTTVTRNVYDQHVSIYLPIGTYKIKVASHGSYGDVGPYVLRASRTGTSSLPWRAEDVGMTGTSGYSQSTNTTTYSVAGSGAQFADDNNIINGFHFLSQRLDGDGQIIAQVTGINGANEWSMGGIMLRTNVEGNDSQYVALSLTKSHGYIRYADNGASTRVTPIFQAPSTQIGFTPTYLKITRVGNVFRFYTSSNGTTYNEIAGSSVTMSMSTSTNIGLYSAGYNDLTWILGNQMNGLQNQRLTVTDFANVAASATGTGVLNPAAFPNLNTFTAPTLTATGSTNTSVSLSWNDVAGQTESGYILERSEDGVNYTTVSSSIGATTFSYTDSTGLHDAEKYWYRIRAKKSDGTVSNPSTRVIVATKPGPVLSTSPMSADTNLIVLRWADVDGETGYKVYRSTSQTGTYAQVGSTLAANATTFVDNAGKSANTTYWYKIETIAPSWTIQTAPFSVNTRWTATAPGLPTSSSSTSSTVTMDWPDFTSPAGATGYVVYRGYLGSAGPFFTYTPVGSPSTSNFTDTGLSPNTTYYYRIFARNSAGRLSGCTVEIPITTAPSGLRAAPQSSASINSSLASAAASHDAAQKSSAPSSAIAANPSSKSSRPLNVLQGSVLSNLENQRSVVISDATIELLIKPRKESLRKAFDIFADFKSRI